MENIIEVNSLNFSYYGENKQPINVLKNVSFSVPKGSFTAVLGHNGSGKSTLAKLLNLILTDEDGVVDGSIKICGKEINTELSEDEIYEIRKTVGMVHQNPDNQIVATTVEEDVAFGPENLGIPSEEIRRRVDDALERVGMTAYAKHAPHRLSGGQKQRVAIAGIIAIQPDIIIFDESTAMLDPHGRDEVMETVHSLRKEKNITVLLISHYMNEAAEADNIIVLNDGEVYMAGTPTEVFSQVEKLRSVSLDVPQVSELMYLLSDKKSGIELPIHTDECAELLYKMIKGE